MLILESSNFLPQSLAFITTSWIKHISLKYKQLTTETLDRIQITAKKIKLEHNLSTMKLLCLKELYVKAIRMFIVKIKLDHCEFTYLQIQ